MSYLYLNKNGRPVTIHSYSAGSTFRACPRKYKLEKVEGWKERENRAAFKFGIAIENALQYFHMHGLNPNTMAEEFVREWQTYENDATLVYGDKEGNWKTLREIGITLSNLYEAKLPTLPINQPRFQLNFRKEMFPGAEPLEGIEFTAYVDMLLETPRPMIVDVKTASAKLDETPNMVSLDGQLRTYAWVSGVQDVALLNFVKSKKNPSIQFLWGHVPEADLEEIGESIGKEIIDIVDAYDRKLFPARPGVRFPNNQCLNCCMRGICLGDDKLRDELVFQDSGVRIQDSGTPPKALSTFEGNPEPQTPNPGLLAFPAKTPVPAASSAVTEWFDEPEGK